MFGAGSFFPPSSISGIILRRGAERKVGLMNRAHGKSSSVRSHPYLFIIGLSRREKLAAARIRERERERDERRWSEAVRAVWEGGGGGKDFNGSI